MQRSPPQHTKRIESSGLSGLRKLHESTTNFKAGTKALVGRRLYQTMSIRLILNSVLIHNNTDQANGMPECT